MNTDDLLAACERADKEALAGPWQANNISGAGWEIRATLPVGFKFDASHHEADGTIAFQTWVLHESKVIGISSERWVQFETKQWTEMQAKNAAFIALARTALPILVQRVRELESQLAKVRERCEHTKWIRDRVHHTDAFHGELKLAREILAILEESSCRW